jgi:hypothetical protein
MVFTTREAALAAAASEGTLNRALSGAAGCDAGEGPSLTVARIGGAAPIAAPGGRRVTVCDRAEGQFWTTEI